MLPSFLSDRKSQHPNEHAMKMYRYVGNTKIKSGTLYFPVREFIYRDTGFWPAQHRRNPEQKNSDMTQAYCAMY